MKRFYQLRIFPRIMLMLVIMMLTMTGIWFSGFYYLDRANDSMHHVHEDNLVPILEIGKVRTNLRTLETHFYQLTLETETAKHNAIIGQMMALISENNQLIASFADSVKEPEEKQKLDELMAMLKEYQGKRTELIQLVLHQEGSEAASQYQALSPLLQNINNGFQELMTAKETEAFENYNRTAANGSEANIIMIAILVGAGLLSILFGIGIARTVSQPVQKVTEWITTFAEKTANGESDLTDRVQVKASGEIGTLISSFNLFIEKVQEIVHTTQESVDELLHTAESLQQSATQSYTSSMGAQTAMHEVSALTAEQLCSTEEVAAVVVQVSSGVQVIADRTTAIADASSVMTGKAQQGDGLLRAVMEQIRFMDERVKEAAATIRNLGEKSQEIVHALGVISGISKQTSLLALNAAIEAARANEHGRGFAVVADEVRKLSEESQHSAAQIEQLITEIKSGSQNAVSAMEGMVLGVESGLDSANQTGQAFERIMSLIEEVTAQLQEISATSLQVSAGAQQTSASVQQLTSAAQTVSTHSQDVVTHATEQLTASEQVSHMAEMIGARAEHLKSIVAGFHTR
ncbi:methyl-accepting chemotaxis protein [Brevibacillus reuszeri]|uniref:methyl-accepting chemotaxis protein n=1 Tax=Brevibacillus reuszeri TaxID=54915 RepID=UPI00289C4789|nr:methyl-accepting chemotaxis protein [Brevibacillus reuszeri]